MVMMMVMIDDDGDDDDDGERNITSQLGGIRVCGVRLTHGHIDIKTTNTEMEQK